MHFFKQPGGNVWIAEAPNWTDRPDTDHLKVGITTTSMSAIADRGQSWMLGQLYGVVCTGLIFTEHVFVGLKRSMYVKDDMYASDKKLTLTWSAKRDARLMGTKLSLDLEFIDAPESRVFAVYISPNQMLDEFPEIFGWMEHWTWIASDPGLAGAPVDWATRYDEKLWSRLA